MPFRQLDDHEADRVADVFQTNRPFIEAVASRHASNPADVPDIVQNVGVSLCRNLDGFRENANIRTWLFRVTVNAARDLYRREGRQERTRSAYETLAPQPVVHPDDQVVQGERLAAIRDAVTRLREPHRGVIHNLLSETGVQEDDKAAKAALKGARFRARHALGIHLLNDRRLG